MISESYPKLVKGLIWFSVFIIIIMPDVIFGFLFDLFHTLIEILLELAHLLFEGIESTLDTVIEHLLDTELHETQVIVFYIMLFAGFYGLYRLLRLVPGMYQRLKLKVLSSLEIKKIRMILYWQGLSINEKIKYVSIGSIIILAYLFFGM